MVNPNRMLAMAVASMTRNRLVRDTMHRVAIQTVSPAADGLLLLTAATVLGLAATSAGMVVRGRRRAAGVTAGVLAALLAGYAAALLGFALASHPQRLAAGDAKCFDDWCGALVSAERDGSGAWVVDVQVQNRGRGRAMRSNLARAYLELPDGRRVAPVDGDGLHALLRPGQRTDVRLAFPAVADARGVRFVLSEGDGGGLGWFEIGGEASPLHARAGWPLS
jgi:hypothetical protein